MPITIRRLGPGDEHILEFLALNDADFDLDERGAPLKPLDPIAARKYLANPAVLHWVAFEDDKVVGVLLCHLLPMRSGESNELRLYEIGVQTQSRRRGTGRALLASMESWTRENQVSEVWVCADNEIAVEFYRACGFTAAASQPVYMSRDLSP